MAGTPHPDSTRTAALARLDAGATAAAVSAEFGVGLRTLRRWQAADRRQHAAARRPGPLRPLRVVDAGDGAELPEDLAEVAVEAALGRGWGAAELRDLAVRGVPAARAHELRARALARTAAHLRADAPERLAEFVLRLNHAEGLALDAGELGTLARLLSLRARVLGLDRLQLDVHAAADVPHGLSPGELQAARLSCARALLETGWTPADEGDALL